MEPSSPGHSTGPVTHGSVHAHVLPPVSADTAVPGALNTLDH